MSLKIIDADQMMALLKKHHFRGIKEALAEAPEIVRCEDCIHAQPLDRNCAINTSVYRHCGLLRGEETNNVWHKYKKYYKDYSIVERDDYCSYGERKDDV